MPPANQILVGMADLKLAEGPAHLTCLGLGSCIGLVAMEPDSGVCGMVHIMLPEAFKDKPVDKPGKFADTGIPELLRQLEKAGVSSRKLVLAYAGGAQVFKYGADQGNRLDVGLRNSAAVAEHLKRLGARVLATDTGGNSGRTMIVNTATGEVRVRTVAGGEKTLCVLRKAGVRAA